MSFPETCPFCGSGSELRNGEKWVGFACVTVIHAGHDARRMQSATCAGLERTRLLARVAELEAQVREAEESSANALARLSAAEATIELRRLENEAVRRQLGHAENACDAMEKRVAELEAENKQAREDEEWAHRHTIPIHRRGDAWVAEHFDGHRILEAEAASITEALRALREKVEANP